MQPVMSLLDVLHSPWAITPEMLSEIVAIYRAHANGEKVDIAAVEARLGRKLDNSAARERSYEVIDGIAVLGMQGVLARRMNLMMQMSGGTSSQALANQIAEAAGDSAVRGIVLAINSPGGTVDGTQSLADRVREAARIKPVAAWSEGIMASAAYWIGAAAGPGMVFASEVTTQVGSIGVVATHVDVSGAEAAQGIKTTEITAGRYKRIASQHAPLTEEGRQTIQQQVDYTYSLFVDAVAQSRGKTPEEVLERMADGRVFMGRQAVAAGLVDDIATLDDVMRAVRQRTVTTVSFQEASMPLNREQLAAEAPDVLAAVLAEGAEAERARIQSVEAQLIPGHEALVNRLKFDGKTTGAEAAMAILAAERQTRTATAAALAADAPQPLPAAAAPTHQPAAPAAAAEDTSLPIEQRCKAKWESSADLQREFSSLGAYTAFVRASETGAARIYSGRTTQQGA